MSVRNSTTIDWTIKESVQASLRRNIRRILKKYNYPPDKQEKAVVMVIEQAKLLGGVGVGMKTTAKSKSNAVLKKKT